MHQLDQKIDAVIISGNHIISKQKVNGNAQTIYYFYKLVQCQTSLSALNLSDVCGRYANPLQRVFPESDSDAGALHEFVFLMHDNPFVYLPFGNDMFK